jgi:hypothetical protein
MPDNLPDDNTSDVSVVPDNQDAPSQPQPQAGVVPETFPQTQKVESIAPVSPEIQKTAEAMPQGTSETSVGTPVVDKTQPPEQPTETLAKHVVDKRSEAGQKGTPLETTQPLTADADLEEADFIEHVEEAHPKDPS